MWVTHFLQAVNPAEELSSLTGQTLDYIKFIFILAGILILAYVTIRFWLPRMLGDKTAYAGPIRVVARYPLEPKKTLYIIKTGPQFFLIGTSEGEIHYLTSLDSDKVEPFLYQEEAKPGREGEFGRFLKGFRRPKGP